MNKYIYIKVIQGNWGYGWEDVVEYHPDEKGSPRADLREYRASGCGGAYRLINRRELNEDSNNE